MKQVWLVWGLGILTGCGQSADSDESLPGVERGVARAAGLERLDLGADSAIGHTWFSIHPIDETLGIFSTHEAWNAHTLAGARRGNGDWSGTGVAPFSGEFSDRGGRFTPGGSLLFSSRRPGSGGDWDLWLVEYENETWGAATALPFPVNTEHRDYHGSMTREGTLYFISTRPGSLGEGDIYRATPGPDGYAVEALPAGINTARWEADVFVSPDERYVIFARTDDPEGLGGDDLFLSMRSMNGWSEPQLLPPPVNSSAYDYGAFVSADEIHLYFTSHRGGVVRIYRVEAAALIPGER